MNPEVFNYERAALVLYQQQRKAVLVNMVGAWSISWALAECIIKATPETRVALIKRLDDTLTNWWFKRGRYEQTH